MRLAKKLTAKIILEFSNKGLTKLIYFSNNIDTILHNTLENYTIGKLT